MTLFAHFSLQIFVHANTPNKHINHCVDASFISWYKLKYSVCIAEQERNLVQLTTEKPQALAKVQVVLLHFFSEIETHVTTIFF